MLHLRRFLFGPGKPSDSREKEAACHSTGVEEGAEEQGEGSEGHRSAEMVL
jgi:hypothetical protein